MSKMLDDLKIVPLSPSALIDVCAAFEAFRKIADETGCWPLHYRGAGAMICTLLEHGCRREDGTSKGGRETWRLWVNRKDANQRSAHELALKVWDATASHDYGDERLNEEVRKMPMGAVLNTIFREREWNPFRVLNRRQQQAFETLGKVLHIR